MTDNIKAFLNSLRDLQIKHNVTLSVDYDPITASTYEIEMLANDNSNNSVSIVKFENNKKTFYESALLLENEVLEDLVTPSRFDKTKKLTDDLRAKVIREQIQKKANLKTGDYIYIENPNLKGATIHVTPAIVTPRVVTVEGCDFALRDEDYSVVGIDLSSEYLDN